MQNDIKENIDELLGQKRDLLYLMEGNSVKTVTLLVTKKTTKKSILNRRVAKNMRLELHLTSEWSESVKL